MLNTNIKNKIDQLGNFMIETFHINDYSYYMQRSLLLKC
jgi:hypothetical protein